MSKTVKEQLQLKANARNMDFEDFLYYHIKELQHQHDFWDAKSYKHIRGAKIRARNLLGKLRDATAVQLTLT